MNRKKRKLILIVCSIALLLTVAVGGTLAYLTVQTEEVTNTFTPSEVKCAIEEKFNGTVKTDVYVQNTGDTDAYIRAAIVVTWQKNGTVHGTQVPVPVADYTLVIGSDWTQGSDGYYYYTGGSFGGIVLADDNNSGTMDDQTTNLIVSCAPTESANAPAGYSLNVEILAQAIQSTPASAVQDAWGWTPSGN